jgi:hypothetical protein
MDIARNTSVGLSAHTSTKQYHLHRTPWLWPSCPFSIPLSTVSAGRYLSIASKWYIFSREKLPTSSAPWKTTWDWRHRTYTRYGIPCECGKVYIGETGGAIEGTVNKHYHHMWLYQSEKLAVRKQHRPGTSECYWTSPPLSLFKMSGRRERIIREARDGALCPIIWTQRRSSPWTCCGSLSSTPSRKARSSSRKIQINSY